MFIFDKDNLDHFNTFFQLFNLHSMHYACKCNMTFHCHILRSHSIISMEPAMPSFYFHFRLKLKNLMYSPPLERELGLIKEKMFLAKCLQLN